MEHFLDQPILTALRTRHTHLAQGGPLAFRYHPDISPLAAVADDSEEALAGLAALIVPGDIVILARVGENPVPPGTVAEHVTPAVQMIAATVSPPEDQIPFQELSAADGSEMLALATLTKPGPYARRTHEFGGYIGIRQEGRLVAMAGQRMQAPGYTEVSAVCTHPDFRGRGYGSFLLRVVAARIKAAGETPYLHAYASNVQAIRLYETLGFVHRSINSVTVLRRV